MKTDIDKLPSLPHCLLSLLEICNSESLPADRLNSLLRYDPALHIRVCATLQHASLYTNEDTLAEAVSRLDRNRLQSIATNAATQQFFSRNSMERTDFIKQHWHHSLVCAHIAEAIATEIEYPHPDEAYRAGLLHDIGQLILECAFPNKYTATFAQLSEDDYFHHLELEEFETTHQEIGSECLRKHGCDPFLADAALYHHEHPSTMLDAHPLAKITYIANLLANDQINPDDVSVFDAANKLLLLNQPPLMKIVEQSRQAVKQIAESLEIELAEDGIDGETAKLILSREQNKQLLLAEQVRNIALLDSVNQAVARNVETDIDSITREQCQLLFGVSDSVLFTYDEATDCLGAHTVTTHSHLNELAIPLESKRSLVTDAVLEKQIVHSFEHHFRDLSVIDRQLIDLYEKQGLLCLPLMLDSRPTGCLVMVVDEIQHSNLLKQSSLLQQFANTLASTLQKTRSPSPGGPMADEGELQSRMHQVVHEVRNPLSIINNYLEILSFKLESESPAQDEIKTIKTEIERIGSIVSSLTEHEQSSDIASEVDVNTLIFDLSNMFRASLLADKQINLKLELDHGLKAITSNANAIKQIYTNLVKNAAEAVPANGKIMVYTIDNVNVDGNEYIELSVVDTGPGIPEELLPKLFSPVETTKQGEHAGLGLTIVKNLVSELHGSIRCRSSKEGTGFYVLLPRT